MDWLKIGIRTQKEAEEIISELLMQVGAHGVSIEGDNETCAKQGLPWDYLDEKVLERVPFCVTAFFPCDGSEKEILEHVRQKLAKLRHMSLGVPLGSLEVITQVVHEEDWENAWKAYFSPVKISDYVVIKPTWEDYTAGNDEIVIEIDPGMAFGTGNHETTKMCVHLLEEYIEPGMQVIDAGCGSGILSISSAKLGAQKVYALDLDPVAVQVTAENARGNGCGDMIEVKKSDLLSALPMDLKADIVVANIIADVVIKLNGIAKNYMKPGGMYICSGIIDTRVDEVRASLEQEGYRVIQILEDGEWRALACKYRG